MLNNPLTKRNLNNNSHWNMLCVYLETNLLFSSKHFSQFNSRLKIMPNSQTNSKTGIIFVCLLCNIIWLRFFYKLIIWIIFLFNSLFLYIYTDALLRYEPFALIGILWLSWVPFVNKEFITSVSRRSRGMVNYSNAVDRDYWTVLCMNTQNVLLLSSVAQQ